MQKARGPARCAGEAVVGSQVWVRASDRWGLNRGTAHAPGWGTLGPGLCKGPWGRLLGCRGRQRDRNPGQIGSVELPASLWFLPGVCCGSLQSEGLLSPPRGPERERILWGTMLVLIDACLFPPNSCVLTLKSTLSSETLRCGRRWCLCPPRTLKGTVPGCFTSLSEDLGGQTV